MAAVSVAWIVSTLRQVATAVRTTELFFLPAPYGWLAAVGLYAAYVLFVAGTSAALWLRRGHYMLRKAPVGWAVLSAACQVALMSTYFVRYILHCDASGAVAMWRNYVLLPLTLVFGLVARGLHVCVEVYWTRALASHWAVARRAEAFRRAAASSAAPEAVLPARSAPQTTSASAEGAVTRADWDSVTGFSPASYYRPPRAWEVGPPAEEAPVRPAGRRVSFSEPQPGPRFEFPAAERPWDTGHSTGGDARHSNSGEQPGAEAARTGPRRSHASCEDPIGGSGEAPEGAGGTLKMAFPKVSGVHCAAYGAHPTISSQCPACSTAGICSADLESPNQHERHTGAADAVSIPIPCGSENDAAHGFEHCTAGAPPQTELSRNPTSGDAADSAAGSGSSDGNSAARPIKDALRRAATRLPVLRDPVAMARARRYVVPAVAGALAAGHVLFGLALNARVWGSPVPWPGRPGRMALRAELAGFYLSVGAYAVGCSAAMLRALAGGRDAYGLRADLRTALAYGVPLFLVYTASRWYGGLHAAAPHVPPFLWMLAALLTLHASAVVAPLLRTLARPAHRRHTDACGAAPAEWLRTVSAADLVGTVPGTDTPIVLRQRPIALPAVLRNSHLSAAFEAYTRRAFVYDAIVMYRAVQTYRAVWAERADRLGLAWAADGARCPDARPLRRISVASASALAAAAGRARRISAAHFAPDPATGDAVPLPGPAPQPVCCCQRVRLLAEDIYAFFLCRRAPLEQTVALRTRQAVCRALYPGGPPDASAPDGHHAVGVPPADVFDAAVDEVLENVGQCTYRNFLFELCARPDVRARFLVPLRCVVSSSLTGEVASDSFCA